jgi:peptidoglycan L-alanyl-D-glutamate endopeptidase CwlK
MDSVSCARLAMVYKPLADKIMQMAEMLEGEGIVIRVVQGSRTWAEQDALYAQGRTAAGKVVTNAKGGYSYHNFGLAVDCGPMLADDSNIDWNAAHPAWKRMEAVGVSLGLVSGANWIRLVDAPHFQLTGRFPEGAPDDEIRALAQSPEGLQAVWDAVTASLT